MFRGRFENSIDQKGRIQLPQALRSNASKSSFFVTNSIYRKLPYLEIYTSSQWLKLEKKISRLPKFNRAVQDYTRFFLSGAFEVKLDGNNRLLVPSTLRKYAGLESQTVCVGAGDHLELWSDSNWQSIHNMITDNFNDALQELSQLEADFLKDVG